MALPLPFFYPYPKSVMIKTPSSLTCLFINNIYLYINIIIKYQLITLFSGISKNIRQGVLSCCFEIEPSFHSSAHAQISPPSFCFSLLSLLSLPWPSSDRRETQKEKKRNEFIKKYFFNRLKTLYILRRQLQ